MATAWITQVQILLPLDNIPLHHGLLVRAEQLVSPDMDQSVWPLRSCATYDVLNVTQCFVLHDVPLHHGFLRQDASEAESAQVQSFKVPIQNEFCNSSTHSRGVLQAVTTEPSRKVHVIDQRVDTDDPILIKCVVVIVTSPGTRHLTEADKTSTLIWL